MSEFTDIDVNSLIKENEIISIYLSFLNDRYRPNYVFLFCRI